MSNIRNLTAKVEFTPTDRIQGFFRAGYFSENRNNAKVGELNDTLWHHRERRHPREAARTRAISRPACSATCSAPTSISSPSPMRRPPRNVVRLATDQNVPTNGIGGMAQWSKAMGSRNAFSAGFDCRWVVGESQEAAYVAAVPTSIRSAVDPRRRRCRCSAFSGGTQQSLGAFVQDIFTPIDKLVLTLSARVDRWNNYNGHNFETTVATGLPTANNRPVDPRLDDTVLSPHLGALYHASDRVSLWGAVNSSFRAPT